MLLVLTYDNCFIFRDKEYIFLAFAVLVQAEQKEIAVEEGSPISFDCSYSGNYVELRQDKKTIFSRTGESGGRILVELDRWKFQPDQRKWV